MASIERDICKAIDIIASKTVASSNHGSTILATVVECLNPLIGKHKLKYQTKEFIAYSNKDTIYSKGIGVYVFLQNGTFDKQMFILGSVDGVREAAAADYDRVRMEIASDDKYITALFYCYDNDWLDSNSISPTEMKCLWYVDDKYYSNTYKVKIKDFENTHTYKCIASMPALKGLTLEQSIII